MKQNKDRFKQKFFDNFTKMMGQVYFVKLDLDYAIVIYDGYNKNEEVNISKGFLLNSTGLKDKSGNLIYEGDIVKWGNRKYVITWIDDEACFQAVSVDNEITTTLKLHEHCEVLGNKFENPELLK